MQNGVCIKKILYSYVYISCSLLYFLQPKDLFAQDRIDKRITRIMFLTQLVHFFANKHYYYYE